MDTCRPFARTRGRRSHPGSDSRSRLAVRLGQLFSPPPLWSSRKWGIIIAFFKVVVLFKNISRGIIFTHTRISVVMVFAHTGISEKEYQLVRRRLTGPGNMLGGPLVGGETDHSGGFPSMSPSCSGLAPSRPPRRGRALWPTRRQKH